MAFQFNDNLPLLAPGHAWLPALGHAYRWERERACRRERVQARVSYAGLGTASGCAQSAGREIARLGRGLIV